MPLLMRLTQYKRKSIMIGKTIQLYKFHELSTDAKERAIEWYRSVSYDDMKRFYQNLKNDIKIGAITDCTALPGYLAEYIRTGIIDNIKFQEIDTYRGTCGVTFNTDRYRLYLDLLNRRELTKKLTYSTKQRLAYLLGDQEWTDYGKGNALHKMLFNESWEYTFDDIKNDLEHALLSIVRDHEEYINSDEYISEHIVANEYEFTEDGEIA